MSDIVFLNFLFVNIYVLTQNLLARSFFCKRILLNDKASIKIYKYSMSLTRCRNLIMFSLTLIHTYRLHVNRSSMDTIEHMRGYL